MSESDREFAFGKDRVDGCACPAVRLGYEPSEFGNDSTEVANYYDWELKCNSDENMGTGTVPEDEAKPAWLAALDEMRAEGVGERYIKAGEEIAEELGWM